MDKRQLLRTMVGDPLGETYSDEALSEILEQFKGDENAAAAYIFECKAAAVAGEYDVNADGADLKRSQAYTAYMNAAAMYRARIKLEWCE